MRLRISRREGRSIGVKRESFVLSLLILLLAPGAPGQQRMWVTGYYAWWTYNTMSPSEIDYSALTHLVIFSANPVRTPPYLDVVTNPHDSENVVNGVDCGIPGNYMDQTIDLAHRKRVKVLLSVGGIYGDGAQNMSYIAQDNGRISAFVLASCAFARRHGFDGIELDWEFPRADDHAGFVMLAQRFRQELDRWESRGLFITAVIHTPWNNLGYDRDALLTCFDQINTMTYEMHYGDYQHPQTGYNTPIEKSNEYPGYNGYALNQPRIGMKVWMDYGIPASKLGLGISFVTAIFSDVAPPVQPGKKYSKAVFGNLRDVPRRGRHWDYSAKVPWQGSGTTMISYEDTASCRLKVEYARALGLGGIMLYELDAGYIPSASPGERDLLVKSVSGAVRSQSPPLGDITPPPVPDTTPPKVVITSPAHGGSVAGTVQFSAVATDNVGVVSVQFSVDGKALGAELGDPPYTSSPLNTWLLGNGKHVLTALARDDAGNSGSATSEFIVLNTGKKPEVHDLVVYDEELHAPFADISWGVKTDFASVDRAAEGAHSMKVDYQPWGALWLQNGRYGQERSIDPSSYTELVFDAFPLSSFTLKVVFSNDVSVDIPLVGGRWNPVRVPINFSPAFKSIYFRRDLDGKTTVYFDNIRLIAARPK